MYKEKKICSLDFFFIFNLKCFDFKILLSIHKKKKKGYRNRI